jgi:hypothetical protein
MREIVTKVFKFEELSKASQQRAIEKLRYTVAEIADGLDSSDYEDALKMIENAFGINVFMWDVSSCGYSFRFDFISDRWSEIEDKKNPSFLLRYFKEVDSVIRRGRYYSAPGFYDKKTNTYHHRYRYSKVIFDEHCYCLTGTWCTQGVDEVLNGFWDYYRKDYSIRDFVSAVLDRFFYHWREDIKYHVTDDYVEEEILSNDWEFLSDGTRY